MRRHHLPAQIRWLFALSLILPLLVTQAALARPAALLISPHSAQQIEFVDQVGGQPQAIYLSGGLAYVVIGPRLFILSIIDASGDYIGKITAYRGTLVSPLLVDIKSVYVSGGYAYLTSGAYGLIIIHVADPDHPALVGQLSLPGQGNDVVVQGSYAFIADGIAGVHAVDVSQPDQPVLVDTLAPDAGDSAFALVAIGNYLYVANYNHLVVVNKSNPAQLTKFTAWTLLGTTDITNVPGDTKIFLTSSGGLQELTILPNGIPSNLRFRTDADGTKLAANGNYIYLLKNGQPGHFVQTVRREDLLLLSITPFDGYAMDLAADPNNHVYKLNHDFGMKIYDTQQVGSLIYASSALLSDLPSGLGMDLYGSSLNVTAGSRGLVRIDISDPAHPFAADTSAVTGSASNVETGASYAYLAAGLDGVRVVPTAGGSEVGGYTLTNMNVTDLALHTRTVNFSTVTDIFMGTLKGVVAVNGTDPTNITPLSALTTPSINEIQIPPTRPGATSSYGYIATDTDFEILLITDPGSLSDPISVLGTYPAVPRPILGFDIEYGFLKVYAYLCADGGMDIVDISAPANITLLGHYPMSCRDVDVVGNRAFVLSNDQVSVMDISDRSDPKRIGFYTLDGIPQDILAYKPAGTPYTYIYTSDLLYGVWALRYSEHSYLPATMRH